MQTTRMQTVYHADGSHTFEFEDGIVFGPYGPGGCDSVHRSGMTCKHTKGHVGDHGTFDFTTPAGTFKHRWTDNPR